HKDEIDIHFVRSAITRDEGRLDLVPHAVEVCFGSASREKHHLLRCDRYCGGADAVVSSVKRCIYCIRYVLSEGRERCSGGETQDGADCGYGRDRRSDTGGGRSNESSNLGSVLLGV